MSMDFRVYVGPYIEAYNPVKQTKVLKSTCTTKGCPQSGTVSNAKFCPDCGNPIGKAQFGAKSRIEFDPDDAFDGRLSEVLPENEDENYIHLSDNSANGIGMNVDDCSSGVTAFDPGRLATEMTQLENKFATEIKTLKQMFGEQSVKIKWGVAGCWS